MFELFQSNWLATASGVASLVSLILQLDDRLNRYDKLFRAVTYISFGSFLSSLAMGLGGAKDFELGDVVRAVCFCLGAAGLVFGGYLIFQSTRTTRDFSGEIIGVITVSLGVLVVVGLSFVESTPREIDRLEVQEIVFLAENAENKGRFDRAIEHYKTLVRWHSLTMDERVKIENRISILSSRRIQFSE